MITVIGLGNGTGIVELLDRLRPTTIVARHRQPAEQALEDQWPVDRDYDAWFASDSVTDIATDIAADLAAMPASKNIVYLVPWSGQVGDRAVAELAASTDISLIPGILPPHPPAANLTIVDALELAEAEARSPFDSGLTSFDATVSMLILNAGHGTVGDLAQRRLRRMRPDIELDASDETYFLQPNDAFMPAHSIGSLLQIVAHLRSPEGCPWDREQTPESLIPSFLEEADELREAIEGGDPRDQSEELGDVLFHVVMQAQIQHEAGAFGFDDVLEQITAKLIRRHPHVFGNAKVESVEELHQLWDEIKRSEKQDPGTTGA